MSKKTGNTTEAARAEAQLKEDIRAASKTFGEFTAPINRIVMPLPVAEELCPGITDKLNPAEGSHDEAVSNYVSVLSEGERFFHDLRLDGKKVSECELALECGEEMYRLYVRRDVKSSSFNAIALGHVSCVQEHWVCQQAVVEVLFEITASCDGVRHMEINREEGDMAGYLYCPNIQGMIALLQKVREIELEVCHSCDEDWER